MVSTCAAGAAALVGSAPPCPGDSLKLNSSGLTPARPWTRSPSASSRISCACIAPSLIAIAARFSFRYLSFLRPPSSATLMPTRSRRKGSRPSAASRNPSDDSKAAQSNTEVRKVRPASATWRDPRVIDLACVKRGCSRIICIATPETHCLPRRIVVLAVIWFQVMASTYSPYQRSSVRRKPKTATGAVDLLRANDTMAALLPTVTRMIALQRDCAAVLPSMFASCDVLQFDAGQLLLSIPNAALAAKLKQQLPKL